MGESIVETMLIPPAKKGLADGLDPALDDRHYPPDFSPDIENIRVGRGLWETRLGMTYYKSLIGSGAVRLLDTITLVNGDRYRLAARGNTTAGALQDLQVGVDTIFQSVSGGTGLGGATYDYFQGIVQNDLYYFTDRNGALKKYTPASGSAATVALPARPTTMPGAKPRFWKYLQSFRNPASGAFQAVLTSSNSGDYSITDVTSTAPNPLGGKTAMLTIVNGNAGDDNIFDTRTIDFQSDTVAWYYKQSRNLTRQQFDLAFSSLQNVVASANNRAPSQDEWYPNFMPTAGVTSPGYLSWRVLNSDASNDKISAMVMPGRLNGLYRWIYTHYDSVLLRESEPSDKSNSNIPTDLTMIGEKNNNNTLAAFKKSCALTFTSDSGTDATTNKIRIYRNGGTAKLTVDEFGREVWYRVGEIADVSTTVASNSAADQPDLVLTSATGFAAGDFVVIAKGTSTEEYGHIASISVNTLTFTEALLFAHTSTQAVAIAFLDNIPNEQVDTSGVIVLERDDPPTGAQWIDRSPDGKLWIFGFTNKPTGVAISNKSTPERPTDYEVFPDGVDPLTRNDPLQGWRFEIGGDSTDEAIMWGGFFGGVATVLTRRHLYRIHAYSQVDWSPNAVQKVLDLGCINGETVQECNGVLYWVADGPRVMRWDGRGAPEAISHERVNTVLRNAPSAYWKQWFAQYHAKLDGQYYCLYLTPTGETTNIKRLDYNIVLDAWEPVVYFDAGDNELSWRRSMVLDSGSDARELYQVDANGLIYEAESGLTDNGTPIKIRLKTKRFALNGMIARLHTFMTRLAAATDEVMLQVTAGGSEYGNVVESHTLDLSGSNDVEVYQKLGRNLLGQWAELKITGNVSNRPSFRDILLRFVMIRQSRYKR